MEAANSSKLSFLRARDPSVDRRFRPRPQRRVNLCNLFEKEEHEDAPMKDNESSECPASPEGAHVYLRIRPVPASKSCPFYKIHGNEFVTHQPEGNGKNVLEKHFSFNNVFDETVDQPSIYNSYIRSKIEDEEDMTLLVYGTSGSGKTFTLLGDLKDPGIIPRALENLFKIHSNNIYAQPSVKIINGILTVLNDDCIKAEEKTRNILLSKISDVVKLHSVLEKKVEREHNFEVNDMLDKSVFVWISFAEIYNEIVFDLLNPEILTRTNKRKGLKIILNQDRAFIKNLTTVYVKSSIEAYKLLTYGLKQITYASTINANSNRSHCIFFVDVITFSYPDIFTHKSYKFCDLAGSERLAKTKNVGTRVKEAKKINSSLMVLGRCLDAVYNNQQKKMSDLIPFRESKLTFLLKSALTAKEKLTMIVNITPSEEYFEENLQVLGFASIAKSIVYKSPEKPCRTRYSWFTSHNSYTLSSGIGSDTNYQRLLEENAQLKSENEELRSANEHLGLEIINFNNQLYQQECKLRTDLVDNFQEILTSNNNLWEQRIAQVEASLIKVYEAKMNSLEVRYQRRIQELERRYYDSCESTADEELIVIEDSTD